MAWIGLNSFGGPIAQIGVMHREAVEKRRWLSDAQFVHLLNFANILPGPEALEIAIHLGYLRRGIAGGIAAGLLFIWPGFVSLAALAWVYERFGMLPIVSGCLSGIRPVAVALIAFAVIRLSARALDGPIAILVTAIVFVANFFLRVPFLILLFAGGLVGVWACDAKSGARFPRMQLPVTLAVLIAAFAAGWIVEMRRGAPTIEEGGAQIGAMLDEHGARAPAVREPAGETRVGGARLRDVAWVNTKAALATFGGAYTLLPYLREQAVGRYGWVTDVQMVDALALGETTPGPLISIGVFIAYLAAGFPGAVVGGVFLFLPSFVLVLSLGRRLEFVERIPHAVRFLWGVTAATFGLILSLTAHVAPRSIVDPFGAIVAVVAFAALWRLRANVILTVACAALLGLARAYLG